ncbi:DUF6543 domain-containing protein [Pseudomonas sp. OA65]|uniref:dermonecrotic toxin domain-containing protein n=1 Tax=Pseudomonas sp. OA65 TaxID=2818431 RepID=UPI001A9E959F|nr:DUF6543 domain-containing protein [Pseudomonas sp. OA65]MBO1539473.1 hypothetical protein [Pseudomonas sp. OA65]
MTSPTPADSPATFTQTISQQFADHPSFETVAQQQLEKAIKARYPTLVFDLPTLQLAMPNEAGDGWIARPFMASVLDYLATGTPVDFSSKGDYDCYLSADFPKRLRDAGDQIPDVRIIEKLLFELPWILPIALEDALIHYWNAELDTHSHANRWQWLGDTLKHILHIRGLQQPGLSEPERDALDQIARWPDREYRFSHNKSPVYAYSLESTLTQDGNSTVLPTPDILLQHYTIHGLVILLCSPGSAVRSFASMDEFNAYWAQRIADRYIVDTVSCQRYEIAGNAFDTQAGMLLEQQLTDLRSVKLPSTVGWPDLKKLYADLSDPARYLTDTPQPTPQAAKPVGALLPQWLKTAPLGDQTKFQHYSLALAGAKQRSDGQTFLSDIKDIRTFAIDALSSRLQHTNDDSRTKVPASHYHPDDVTLTYTVAAGYPGAIGISEPRVMSLTDLAINNLVARPSGQVKLSHRQGLALPQWLTNEFITRKNGLIEQVDIGTTYPKYLERALLRDSERENRERRFAEQMPAQWVLEALQQMHTKTNGMTRQGLDLIEALFASSAEERQVDGRPVVIRNLALLRKPQATPDTVVNMFIIESKDATTGPHLLYRPLDAPSLQQFTSRQALFDAIATTGPLQDSVLTWLPDTARPIYANGGFKEPHIVRFYQGDEYSVPDRPAPATLAVDEASGELLQYLGKGELMQYLYGGNAHALIAQADRASVSNSESRWALLLKGGSLLFNTLLFPLLRGPAMSCVWLFNLMLSAQNDIPALTSEDPVTRELAAVDLLLNLALLAVQVPSVRVPLRVPVTEPVMEQAMRTPAPRAVPQQWPAPPTPKYIEGIVALPGEQSHAPTRALDFSFASARHRLTPEQQTQLQGMQVNRPAKLPEPIVFGPLKGLYVIGAKWHAVVDQALYPVDVDVDDNVKIIDPQDPSRNGPMLKSDGHGNWTLDLNLRMRGGMPKSRIQELKERKKKLNKDLDDYLASQASQSADLKKADQKVRDGWPRDDGKPPRDETGKVITPEQHRLDRQALYELLERQIATDLKMLASQDERKSLNVELKRPELVMITQSIFLRAEMAYGVVCMDLEALANDYPGFNTYPTRELARSKGPSFLDFHRKNVSYRERAIHWAKIKDEQLENLLNLDATSVANFSESLLTFDKKHKTVLTLQDAQLITLPIVSVKTLDSDLFETLFEIIYPLSMQISAHSSIKYYTLPPSEHLAVLASLTEQYGRALEALEVAKILYIEELEEIYFDKMVSLVKDLYDEVSGKLAAEVKPEPNPRKRPAKPAFDRKKKRLIMTRKAGVLIGDIKPAGTNVDVADGSSLPIEVVEIHSEINGEVLETYSRHDDVWDVVEVRRPAPAPRTRAVKTIQGDAQKLLKQLDNRLRRAEGYKKRCRHPQEIEEIMNNEASRYRTLMAELDRAFAASGASPSPADQALSQQLSNAISSLAAKGAALRTELSLELPPTDGNLQYLFEKKLIQVARLGERKALKGARKDFLQEYAINDTDGFPLWYAHFHYETANTPKADYSVAHLKTKEQRREHYHSLLAKADSPYAVVNVHRGQIGKFLARDRFLPLAP